MKKARVFLAAAALAAFVLVNLAPSCDPKYEAWMPDGQVSAVAVRGNTIFIGGRFDMLISPDGGSAVLRKNLAAINIKTGRPTPWMADTSEWVGALLLSPDGKTLYVGGRFTEIGGKNRSCLAAVDADWGDVLDWDPNVTSNSRDPVVYCLALEPTAGEVLFVGGFFDRIGGHSRKNLAAVFATGAGLVKTDWRCDAGTQHGLVQALAAHPYGWLYVGGSFADIGGENQALFAAASSFSGGLIDGFRPKTDDVVTALTLDPVHDRLYVGGYFEEIDSQTRERIAALRPAEKENYLLDWNPSIGGPRGSRVTDIAVSPTGRGIYAVGIFEEAGGRGRSSAALFEYDSDTATDWNPRFEEFDRKIPPWLHTVGLTDDGSSVFVGGKFDLVNFDLRTNLAQFDPYIAGDWLLPGGVVRYDGTDFDSYILISNPNDANAVSAVYFHGMSGLLALEHLTVPPRSRRTLRIGDYVDGNITDALAVSTAVVSSIPVKCERATYWPGGQGPDRWRGGAGTIGISEPATEWNLPEGATHVFDEMIYIYNPGPDLPNQPVWVEVTFMDDEGNTRQEDRWLDGGCNWWINVADVVGSRPQVSTRVTSLEGPVVVARSMFTPLAQPMAERLGHTSRGLAEGSSLWYLAEGATHLFDAYVLVSNPSASRTANVQVIFTDELGDELRVPVDIPPKSRRTININDVWDDKAHISTRVTSNINVPVFVERAMYWPKGGPWQGGHNTIAAHSLHPEAAWHLPEGATHLFDMYVLVFNPSTTLEADVHFTLMDGAGEIFEFTRSVGPLSRHTVNVSDIDGWDGKDQISTVVRSLNPNVSLVVERAMYFPKGGPGVWRDGHVTVGIAK